MMSVYRSVKWGELLGMRKIETVEQMPEEYKVALMKVIFALASTEFASEKGPENSLDSLLQHHLVFAGCSEVM